MDVVEFGADIEDNVIPIPPDFKSLNHKHVRVVVSVANELKKILNSRDFFGVGKLSKIECEKYISELDVGWQA